MNEDNLNSFASEMLQEIKDSARRWFVAFIIMTILEVFTIFGFVWYISLPTDESVVTQNVDDVNGSEIHQIEGNYGESNTNDY